VQAIIDLAHGLDHVVIAEGVENDAELALLQELGCDMAQGWLFGHPLSPEEALLVAASATSRSL
jgi:EAL domain-containing protein (putative c-di-GMP-specific phosphodiesterase class I)